MKDKKNDSKKNISGYSERQRKEYQDMYERAARDSEKNNPQTFKPNTRGASEVEAIRMLDTKQRYNKSAADLVSRKRYSDGDIGSVKSDVLSRNEALRYRGMERVNSPVKGAQARMSPKETAAREVAKKIRQNRKKAQ